MASSVLSALAAVAARVSPAPSASPTPALSPMPTPLESAWLSPLPTMAPLELGGGPDLPIWSYLFQLCLVTAAVAAVGFYGLRYLRDKVPGLGLHLPGTRGLRIVDRVTVDQTRMVFVVNVGKRYFLLAASGEHIATVAELNREDIEADFGQLVEKERIRGDNP